jgi:hypothetical protein
LRQMFTDEYGEQVDIWSTNGRRMFWHESTIQA